MRPGLVTLALLAGMLSATSLVAEPRRETAPTSGRNRAKPYAGCEGLRKGTDEWSALAGFADAVSINNSRAGRRFAMQALSWGRTLTRPKGPGFLCGQLEVLVEVVPVFVMFQSQRAYGYGVTPVFFRWNVVRRRRIQPFVEIAGGLLRTDRPVPEETRRRNFTAQTGLGFRARLGERRALLLGYRFHHISNAGPGEINPSVNSNFFYAGLSILR